MKNQSASMRVISLIVMFVTCILWGTLMSVVYRLIVAEMLSDYVNIFLAVALGFLMVLPVKMCVKLFNLKSAATVSIVFLLAFVVVAYAKWTFFFAQDLTLYQAYNSGEEYSFFEHYPYLFDNWGLILSLPEEFTGLIRSMNEYGTWTYDGNPVTGVILYIVWIVETVILLAPAAAYFLKFGRTGYSSDSDMLRGFYHPLRPEERADIANLDFSPLKSAFASMEYADGLIFLCLAKTKGVRNGKIAFCTYTGKNGRYKKKLAAEPVDINADNLPLLEEYLSNNVWPSPVIVMGNSGGTNDAAPSNENNTGDIQ